MEIWTVMGILITLKLILILSILYIILHFIYVYKCDFFISQRNEFSLND